MVEPGSHAELIRSLGRMVRGLSALFWGLPIQLIATARVMAKPRLDLETLDFLPPVACSALLVYGFLQLGAFRPGERIWQRTLDRAKGLGLVNLGLSPFVFWWIRFPDVMLFQASTLGFAISNLLLLFYLNRCLQRIAAMLPNQTLRQEVNAFTTLNLFLIVLLPAAIGFYFGLMRVVEQFPVLQSLMMRSEALSQWMFVLLLLLPVAMTMALTWKIKEFVLAGAFEQETQV